MSRQRSFLLHLSFALKRLVIVKITRRFVFLAADNKSPAHFAETRAFDPAYDERTLLQGAFPLGRRLQMPMT